MGKLVLHLPDGSTLDIPLARERVTIGRRADNDVCLPYPAVSGEHAAIVTILQDSFLEDLGSTNGTLVNGKPVAKHFLRDRDEIDIGRQRLVYSAESAADAAPAPPPRAVPAGRGASPPPPADPAAPDTAGLDPGVGDQAGSQFDIERFVAAEVGAERAAAHAALPDEADVPPPARDPWAPTPAIRVASGPSAGREIVLEKDETVVGRVGVQVAAVRRAGAIYRLVAIEGATPPSVNGAPVPAEGRALAVGDAIQVAGVRLEFVSSTEGAAPSTAK